MPTIEEALQIGWKRHQSGDVQGAEQIYRQVLAVAPTSANAWCFLGMACHDQRRYDESIAAYQQAIQAQPAFPVALSNMGNTYKQLGRFEEAEACCRKAVRLKPDYANAHNNLGVALVSQGRLVEAASTFEQALKLMPDDVLTHSNLYAVLVRQGQYAAAEQHAQRALDLNPNYADVHKNQGIIWLLMGEFERGWPEYEWRWQCPGSNLPSYKQPMWDGSSLDGKTILMLHEQGLGDTIQFIRYASILKKRGARVIVKAQKPLMKLLAGCAGVDVLVCDDAELPEFDMYIPMLSIPGRLKTTFETIPDETPYLHAQPSLVAKWKERLDSYDGFKIGIAWQGSVKFHADAQRSIALKHFAPLADVEGVRLFSLQKGYGSEQVTTLKGAFEVIDFGDELDASAGPFMDTAAIMRNLDLLITSDTSVPHLAGALGVPTWMAVSIAPDWRWLLDRDDCPWYRSLRLFRQKQLDDWESVFRRIATELSDHVTSSAKTPAVVVSHAQPATVDTKRILTTGFNSLKCARRGYMLFNHNDVYIGRSFDEYGEFSEGEIAMFERLVSAGDIVVEAGANIGAHTVALAQLVGPAGFVHAFEPQRLAFQTLCGNIALNSLANVACRNVAVGAEPGEIAVPLLNPDHQLNFAGLGLGQYKTGEQRPVVPLDSLGLPDCRLLKVDVEGMELEVLTGAAQLIRKCQPVMYVENDRQEHSADLIKHIVGLSYRMWWHIPPLFNSDNYFRNSNNVFDDVGSMNMLCIPAGEEFDAEGLHPIEGPQSNWQDAL